MQSELPRAAPEPNKVLRILLVEDNDDDAALVERTIRKSGWRIEFRRVETAASFQAAINEHPWDVVLSDFHLPSFDAFGALRLAQAAKSDAPFIIVSGTVGEDSAVAAMKAGAHDYVMKSNLTRLVPAVEREIQEAANRRERRSLELQLRQAQKLDAIGQLAGGVAHDFNNLLTVILSYGTLLINDLAPDDPKRDDLNQIIECGRRAAELTRQLLTFGRRQVFEMRQVELNSTLTNIVKMLRRLVPESIELSVQPSPSPWLINGDNGGLEQVIVNLVVNARDAMPTGGKISVSTMNIEVSPSDSAPIGVKAGDYVRLAVTDSGTGMTAETQARIFEPFFTTKEAGKGTGLGLATVHGIVRQLGGTVSLDSELGKGTTFRVYLPRATQGSKASEAPRKPAAPRTGTERVLVVEDEPALRAMTCRVLRSAGYQVADASKPSLALKAAESEAFDVVITDLVLPEMNGRELVTRLRALKPALRVLYMSGYPGGALTAQQLADDGVPFMPKPFTPDVLLHKVREALDGTGLREDRGDGALSP